MRQGDGGKEVGATTKRGYLKPDINLWQSGRCEKRRHSRAETMGKRSYCHRCCSVRVFEPIYQPWLRGGCDEQRWDGDGICVSYYAHKAKVFDVFADGTAKRVVRVLRAFLVEAAMSLIRRQRYVQRPIFRRFLYTTGSICHTLVPPAFSPALPSPLVGSCPARIREFYTTHIHQSRRSRLGLARD